MGGVARRGTALLIAGLVVLLCVCVAVSLVFGVVSIRLPRLLALLAGAAPDPREYAVLWRIRLPRAALAIAVGAALGAAGAAQQGLFRNPLADPALIGVSGGAALGAVSMIVLGHLLPWSTPLLVPGAAFVGALAASWLALGLGLRARAGAAGLLLAGVAVTSLATSVTGLLITMSDDRQLRDITFWSMGSLASGGWVGAAAAGSCAVVALGLLWPASHRLDALLLGEQEAASLGVDIARLQRLVIATVALAVGAAVANSGIIGFVGLVVPHVVRLLGGVRHRVLLPAAALLGASLLLLADTGARIVAAPAELPIGLVTALLGAPFFIALLWRRA